MPLAAEDGHHFQYDPEQDDSAAKGADNDDVGLPHRNAAWGGIERESDADTERQEAGEPRRAPRESDQGPDDGGGGEERFSAEAGCES